MPNQTLTAPKGFRVAAVKAGIKTRGGLDLGLIVTDEPCDVAATFTQNRIVSPAVAVSREHVRTGKVRAVYVNAGNANTCTGKRGLADVHAICGRIAEGLGVWPTNVLAASTGIIGEMLPMEKVRGGIDEALGSLSRSARAGNDLARAILTTDRRAKSAYRSIRVGGKEVKVAGIVKGAGMIEPNMATMLGFITTDVSIRRPLLNKALQRAVSVTFNKVSIDKHQSTSDTALVLASGLAENRLMGRADGDYKRFSQALWEVCDDLARQMALDGEGARCAVTVKVMGAATEADARRGVRAIVDSPLVRTAFHGADPNWGRIVSAVGFSGAQFDPEKLSCKIAGTRVYGRGKCVTYDPGALSKKMKNRQWTVEVNLGCGRQSDFCYTCDLSKEYVAINANYHT